MRSAVFFDLFETLVSESGLNPTRASSLGPLLGIDDRRYRQEWRSRRAKVRRGEISFAAALTEIAQAVGARVDAAVVERLRRQRIEEKADVYERVSEEIRTLVDSLANRGVALAVISNGFDEEAVAWRASRFSRSFQCSVFSSSEGVAKPDPEIYRRALYRLGVDPDRTVYVGDGGDHELEGAERAGLRAWRAAWFVRDPPGGTCTASELTAPAQVLRALESVVKS